MAAQTCPKREITPDKMVTNFIIVSSLSIFLVAGLDFRWGRFQPNVSSD